MRKAADLREVWEKGKRVGWHAGYCECIHECVVILAKQLDTPGSYPYYYFGQRHSNRRSMHLRPGFFFFTLRG